MGSRCHAAGPQLLPTLLDCFRPTESICICRQLKQSRIVTVRVECSADCGFDGWMDGWIDIDSACRQQAGSVDMQNITHGFFFFFSFSLPSLPSSLWMEKWKSCLTPLGLDCAVCSDAVMEMMANDDLDCVCNVADGCSWLRHC